MKKALLLILALALALASLSFALAEEEKEAGLFELLENNGGTLTRIVSAVPVANGAVIVPAALLPEDPDRLVISDGVTQWESKAVIPDDAGVIATIFFDDELNARFGAWHLMPLGTAATTCRVRSAEAEDREVLGAEEIRWKGKRCYLLSLSGPAPAGSALLTEDGQLAGLVIAGWAEGINRVLALTTEEIAADLVKAISLLDSLPEWGEAPEGLNVTADRNTVTIDWKDMKLPEKAEGEHVYIVLVDTGNSYLSFFPAETERRSVTELLTPGRLYVVGPAVTAGSPDSIPESFAVISLPPAKQLTEYSFRPVVTAIAEAPETGLQKDEQPVPVTEVTEELLRSGRAYFYSHSVYEVTETIEGKSLLVTLTDPNGVNYRYVSSWIYMPEYSAEDIWFLSLKETGLTEGLDRNGYPAGVYRMAYYVDGELADSFEFELK